MAMANNGSREREPTYDFGGSARSGVQGQSPWWPGQEDKAFLHRMRKKIGILFVGWVFLRGTQSLANCAVQDRNNGVL